MTVEINSRQMPGELFEVHRHLIHHTHAQSTGGPVSSFPSNFRIPNTSSVRGDVNPSRSYSPASHPAPRGSGANKASNSLPASSTHPFLHTEALHGISTSQLGMNQREMVTREVALVSAQSSKPRSTREPSLNIPPIPRPAKRKRASHDVDGPETDKLPCKKRRLLLHFTTSRLSQPYSFPATHILIRESSDDMPVLQRIHQAAAVAARRVSHQSSLVRKAAILNRIRIGVRQSAVLRGHTIMASVADRNNAFQHGLQVVTGPASGLMGARFPESNVEMNISHPPMVNGHPVNAVPAAWQPHTRAFHPPMSLPNSSPSPPLQPTAREDVLYDKEPDRPSIHQPENDASPIPPPLKEPRHITELYAHDEEEHTAFPSASFHDRYADLSDDDMDDVYADFSVLFGSRSPEPGNPADEHFYEELLDELDGIPWVS
ncbi:hypothetical protein GGR57DRAFT_239136 [Xylariaceae sp. FL1272]|nr:hypothetical protein GGR57DRAFT_239136 [Xylariaceae sp. FL1272]